jgi:glycosyltransferase involved in cell wall biosynthesis
MYVEEMKSLKATSDDENNSQNLPEFINDELGSSSRNPANPDIYKMQRDDIKNYNYALWDIMKKFGSGEASDLLPLLHYRPQTNYIPTINYVGKLKHNELTNDAIIGLPEVSVVIPTKNEEKSIGICLKKIQNVFKEQQINGEIIVADSSTDMTPEIAKSFGAKVVTPDKLGYGYAYQYGIARASGKYIVMGDADNTYDFEDIPRLLEPLKAGEADMVMGSRFKGKILKGAMPRLHKYIGNPLLTLCVNITHKSKISDCHSGFRAFTWESYDRMELKTPGMEYASEMVMRALTKGLRIVEKPITYYPRVEGSEPNLSSFSDGWRHLKFIFLEAPNHLFILPGAMLSILGLMLILMVWAPFNFWDVGLGLHSMAAGSLFAIVGYQVLFLGLFAKLYSIKHEMRNHDYMTRFIAKHVSLERGITAGMMMFLAGFIFALYLAWNWVNSGFMQLPVLDQDIAGITLMVIGLQTVFNSLFVSVIGGID